MKLSILLLLCLLPLATAQCPATITKIKSLITTILNDKSLNSMIDILVKYLKQNLSLQQAFDKEWNCTLVEKRTDCLPFQLMGGIPATQYLSLMGIGMGAMNCVLDTGYTFEKASADLMKPMMAIWTPIYQTLRTKCVTMMKNKKSDTEIKNQMCTLSTAALTKAVLQKTITTGKNKLSNKKVWDCVSKYLPQVANPQYKQYTW